MFDFRANAPKRGERSGLPGPGADAGCEIRSAREAEFPALLDWLDDGLRDGRRGRIRDEYGGLPDPGSLSDHVIVRVEGRLASHALIRVARARARGVTLPVGMIGLVYTDPRFRGRGLASRCIETAVSRLAASGAWLAALWSDRHAFYARLGFHPAGSERLYEIDSSHWERAGGRRESLDSVGPPRASEWRALESLYDAKPSRVLRRPGRLEALARAPDCRVAVCRRGGRPVAYATCGRGDDFAGVVHEWAGEPEGVLACLGALIAELGPLRWLVGPIDEAPAPELRRAGAVAYDGCFALMRLLDPAAIWQRLSADAPELADASLKGNGESCVFRLGARALPLRAERALQLFLGAEPPAALLGLLDDAQRRALRARLPWPLFAWGFDSI